MQITGTSPRRSLNSLDILTRQTASALITVYQKQISPRKGFSCAYRILHKAESCSQYAKRIILEHGINRALPLIRQRFEDCKVANQTLKARLQCRSVKQRVLSLRTLPAGVVINDFRSGVGTSRLMAIGDESVDDSSNDEAIVPPDENSDPGDDSPKRRKRLVGGSFRKPPITNSADTNSTTNQNNCSDWNCDAFDCASLGCDAIDCSSTDCSGLDCGTADCQSLDCSGLDCSGADCSSLDCGSCDFGSCDCSF